MTDEFYIGWKDRAPVQTSRTVRRLVLIVVFVVVALAGVVAFEQRLIGRAVFEWGKVRPHAGIMRAHPVPHLVSARDGTNKVFLLVRPWKFGFDPELAAKFDGQPVALRGTLIYRDDQAMIEVEPASVRLAGSPLLSSSPPGVVSLGERTFVGEIVDSKCFLGVMNPGQLKPHRACAVRCISGGVPPVLLVRQANGMAACLLLVSRDGKPVNKDILDLVAEPVRITGQLMQDGDLLILRADPAAYQRL